MKKAVKLAAGLALTVLAFWLFLRNVDLSKVAESLRQASVPLLLVSIVVGYFGHLACRSWRWRTMLEPMKERISFYNLFSTTAIGYAISWLTPGRVGEAVRPILLARRESIPVAGALATAVMERVLDVATIVALAAVACVTAPLWWHDAGSGGVEGRAALVRTLTWIGVAGLAGCVVGLLVLRMMVLEDSAFIRWLDRRRAVEGTLGKAWGIVRHLAEGASFLRSPRRALIVGVESIVLWIVVGIGGWVGLLAARVSIPLPGIFLLVAVSALGLAVPTPGGAGSVHFAFQRGLIDLFGVEPNLASAATFLYHPITIYFPPIIFGLLFAWRDGVRPSRVKDDLPGTS